MGMRSIIRGCDVPQCDATHDQLVPGADAGWARYNSEIMPRMTVSLDYCPLHAVVVAASVGWGVVR